MEGPGGEGKTSPGEERERLRDDGVGGGLEGKRKDFVDQVCTRLRGVPECCVLSERRGIDSVVGVEGGVRGEAKTSN